MWLLCSHPDQIKVSCVVPCIIYHELVLLPTRLTTVFLRYRILLGIEKCQSGEGRKGKSHSCDEGEESTRLTHNRALQGAFLYVSRGTYKNSRIALLSVFHVEHFYLLGINTFFPPIYGCNTSGILTLPSSLRLFSSKAISILGGATTVLLRV